MTQRRKFLLSVYCFDATEGRINSTQLLSLLFFHFNQVKAYLPIPTYFDPLMMMVVQCRSSIYFLIVMCRFTNYGFRSSKTCILGGPRLIENWLKKVVNFWVSNVGMDQNQIIEPDNLNLKKENST